MRFIFITFLLVVIQFLTFGMMKSLFWLFAERWSKITKRVVGWTLFVISNGLLLVSMLRVWHGSFRLTAFWMVVMLFTLFAMLATWLLQYLLVSRVKPEKLALVLRVFAPLMVVALFGLSLYNAYTPMVKRYQIQLDKPLAKPLRIGMVSDLHLGVLFGANQLDKLAQIMAHEQVDLILMPGDIMDDNTVVYEAQNMQPHFAQLRAPLGVFATLGNHDIHGYEVEITREIEKAGIQVLNDEAVETGGLVIVGRPDDSDRQRLPTAELLKKVDTAKPLILLDHRPTGIEAHAQLPIDIQVSGHVHNGQVFPANLIVRAINRLHYGYEKIGNGHFVVTSGYGFWGIPLRLGSQSEVVILEVIGR